MHCIIVTVKQRKKKVSVSLSQKEIRYVTKHHQQFQIKYFQDRRFNPLKPGVTYLYALKTSTP